MTRALAAAASDDAPAGPTPEQLGVKPKTVPVAKSPNVLRAEANRKLEEARRLA